MLIENIQATTISLNREAILITGNSGSGKSSLALSLIEQGGVLISDDVTSIFLRDGCLFASPHPKMAGCLEVRGLGILTGLEMEQDVPILVEIHLASRNVERLPLKSTYVEILGVKVRRFELYQDSNILPILLRTAVKIVKDEVFLLQNS